jgi:hypothetical protein
MMQPGLAGIVALARAGALDEAVRRFEAADLPRDHPAALIVKGRLLKDLALQADPEERRRFYLEAAEAYRRSAELEPATYPLINAATLSALGGNAAEAAALAQRVLRSIEEQPDEPETPYYRAATRAEALLLLQRTGEAQAALAEAISLAPRAWEDRATTLRQFRLVLEVQGRDAAWLDEHRPPRSLHFGGHMAFDAQVVSRERLRRSLDTVLDSEKVGFAYGALAAGADIIIAEMLAARGAELHAVLPGGPHAFAAASVDPLGPPWRRRFDALIEQAETVRTVRPAGFSPTAHTIGLADEIAMGAAVMNARRLESDAVQLLVVDGKNVRAPAASATLEAQRIWAAGNRRQHLVQAPREAADAVALPTGGEGRGGAALAVIAIIPPAAAREQGIEQWLRLLRETIGEVSDAAVRPYWSGGQILVAHRRLGEAADLMLRLRREGHSAGADYIAAAVFTDPFSGGARLPAAATGAAEAAARSAPPSTVCVTEDFAAALAARGSGGRTEYVGELDAQDGEPPLGLYALR